MFRRTALTVGCAVALALAGCSADPAMPGQDGPGQTFSSVPVATTAPSSSSDVLPGLSAACTAVIEAQVAISTELDKSLDGKALTADGVRAVFDRIGPDVPPSLTADIDTLRQAAQDSVGKSVNQVEAIVSKAPVASALQHLVDFVQDCAPQSS